MKKRSEKLTTELNNKIGGVKDVVSKFKAEIKQKIIVFKENPNRVEEGLTRRMDSREEKNGKYIKANDVKVDLNKIDEDHLASCPNTRHCTEGKSIYRSSQKNT